MLAVNGNMSPTYHLFIWKMYIATYLLMTTQGGLQEIKTHYKRNNK